MTDSWSSDIEQILEKIRVNCVVLETHHKRKYFWYPSFLKYFRIPIIVLSATNSVVSVGLQGYLRQSYITILTCILSLVSGIITSTELYLSIQTSMESELIMSKDFYSLSITIHKTTKLDRNNRGINAKLFLNEIFNTYLKLREKSNLISEELEDKLNTITLPPIDQEFHSPSEIANLEVTI